MMNGHQTAPGLKTIEDALEIRRRIFLAFELAEREPDPERRQALMTFVIIGGGPTGVELAGTLGELTQRTLKNHFRSIDPAETNIFCLREGSGILLAFPPDLSAKAAAALAHVGVTVRTAHARHCYRDSTVTMRSGEAIENLRPGPLYGPQG